MGPAGARGVVDFPQTLYQPQEWKGKAWQWEWKKEQGKEWKLGSGFRGWISHTTN